MFLSSVTQTKLVTFKLKLNLTFQKQLNLSTKLTMLMIHDCKYSYCYIY